MKIDCIIPARSGSKSVPKKNIIDLGGHPLISYSIAAAKLSNRIDNVIVSTDSEEFAYIAKQYGASVPFLRPAEISQDTSTDIEFFQHYLNFIRKENLEIPNLIVHLSPTAPFREVDIIDSAIDYMIRHDEATSLRSMHRTKVTPYKMFGRCCEYAVPFLRYRDIAESYNLPRQIFPTAYFPNGHVDIVRPEVLEAGTLHGDKIKIWETYSNIDIDSLDDYNLAESWLQDSRFEVLREYLDSIIL